jgi:hypothetical protein
MRSLLNSVSYTVDERWTTGQAPVTPTSQSFTTGVTPIAGSFPAQHAFDDDGVEVVVNGRNALNLKSSGAI